VFFRQNSQSRENINFPEDEVSRTAEGERSTGKPSPPASPGTSPLKPINSTQKYN